MGSSNHVGIRHGKSVIHFMKIRSSFGSMIKRKTLIALSEKQNTIFYRRLNMRKKTFKNRDEYSKYIGQTYIAPWYESRGIKTTFLHTKEEQMKHYADRYFLHNQKKVYIEEKCIEVKGSSTTPQFMFIEVFQTCERYGKQWNLSDGYIYKDSDATIFLYVYEHKNTIEIKMMSWKKLQEWFIQNFGTYQTWKELYESNSTNRKYDYISHLEKTHGAWLYQNGKDGFDPYDVGSNSLGMNVPWTTIEKYIEVKTSFIQKA
jgi:hypothetical protein